MRMTTRKSLEVQDFNIRAAEPTRRFYGEALVVAARRDPRIVCMSADLTLSTETDLFRDTFPDRFVQAGIAEANMIGVAAGMARLGDVPFVHSFCVFATRRCYDQIAMQAAYPRLPVKIIGVIPGLTTMLGVSHQAIDDIALMRALPNMTVIEPSSPEQVGAAVEAALGIHGPVYLRLKRADGTERAGTSQPLEAGRMRMLREGGNALIVACGLMVAVAMEAAERLSLEGLSVGVAEMATIKPIDLGLVEAARRVPIVVTAENHSIVGGLGSAVAELLLEAGAHPRFARIGVRDMFAEGGSTPYLLERYGLSSDEIANVIRRLHS